MLFRSGRNQVYSFLVSKPFDQQPNKHPSIYQIRLKLKNPEASEPSEENELEFRTIVSERVFQEIPDPAWVKNSEQGCPPDCSSQ